MWIVQERLNNLMLGLILLKLHYQCVVKQLKQTDMTSQLIWYIHEVWNRLEKQLSSDI